MAGTFGAPGQTFGQIGGTFGSLGIFGPGMLWEVREDSTMWVEEVTEMSFDEAPTVLEMREE